MTTTSWCSPAQSPSLRSPTPSRRSCRRPGNNFGQHKNPATDKLLTEAASWWTRRCHGEAERGVTGSSSGRLAVPSRCTRSRSVSRDAEQRRQRAEQREPERADVQRREWGLCTGG
ncbi:hypothetical protein HBB16_20600 [Pseudonocardia sp. MCCB 268]|nr:hypothetical protein [Pseudonocardia cytotoxica]